VSFPGPAGGVLVADGGLATELEARGHDLSDALWSARLLMDAPREITAAHLAFFRAGAVIATTASYQASFGGFAARGLPRGDAVRLMRRSVELAQAARDDVAGDGRTRWVAASVGPYGAALADGSEYRRRYGLSVAALVAWHRPRLEVLVPDRGRHGRPAGGAGRGAIQPRLHDDAVDVTAAIPGRHGFRDPQAVPGQLVQQAEFPVQAGRRPP
jgi:homocysteine S-methyltransferase